MQAYIMCEECQKEYDNRTNWRFHAQPNCCENCGLKPFLTDSKGIPIECKDAIDETIKLLEEGKILAIKRC